MSVPYGMPPGSYPPASGVYQPPGRVSYGWIGEAFSLVGRAAGFWILAVLLYGIINNAVDSLLVHTFPNPDYVAPPGLFGGSVYRFGVQYGTNSNATPLGQGLSLLFTWLFGSFQAASLYKMAVKQVRGQNVVFGDLVGGGSAYGNMLLLYLALSVLYVLGIFAVCLGVFVVSAFFLAAPALGADGRSAAQALSESAVGMKQDWLSAVLFSFVFALLIAASVLPCGLGLFVTLPMFYIVSALAYRDMIGMPNLSQPLPAFGTAPGVWPPAPSAAPPPQWGTAPAPPSASYPGYTPQQAPPSQPASPPPSWGSVPETPSWGTPASAPEATSDPPVSPPEEPPANPWQPRPSPPPPPLGE